MTGAAKINDLIVIEGNDPEATTHVRAVIEDLASKPEINAMLVKAKTRHQKPLRFLIGPYHEVALYHPDENVINVDIEQAKKATFKGENGEEIKATPEAILAHEIYHAADEDHRKKTGAYRAQIQALENQCVPAVDWKLYKNRFDIVRNNKPELELLLGEIYDTHIAPIASTLTQTFIDMIRRDPFITDYVNSYETPAIRFSNEIATKYYNQPAQTTDYLSTIRIMGSMSRKDFISNLSEQLYQPANLAMGEPSTTQLSRGGARSTPKPREGGWVENS